MHQYQHEEHSMEELGLAYKKVHAFLDQYFDLFRSLFHRCALHHQKGIELVIKECAESYGADEARAAAELHIMDDLVLSYCIVSGCSDWLKCEIITTPVK